MRSLCARSAVMAALVAGACGPHVTYALDGTWFRGGISGDHFGIIVLLLREENGEVTGAACRTSSGHLIFRDLPVTGRYPRISFAMGAGRYTGGIISEDRINGHFEHADGYRQQWSFSRTSLAVYERCQSARP